MLSFTRTDASNTNYKRLVASLDKYLAITDGDDHAFYNQFNSSGEIKHVILAVEHGEAVGCGAFKPYDARAVEIKRMFVAETHRKQGIAQKILAELENWAAELNYSTTILETGKNQPEAIRLYEQYGYKRTPNYGQYAQIENSVCMKKTI
jgi:putative acetyltransferase